MLVHSVYFWLKEEANQNLKNEFASDLKGLSKITSVRHLFVGRPSSTNRPVIDRTYTYALTVIFDDLAGHDQYQNDPLHLAFVKKHSGAWSKVLIYDAE